MSQFFIVAGMYYMQLGMHIDVIFRCVLVYV